MMITRTKAATQSPQRAAHGATSRGTTLAIAIASCLGLQPTAANAQDGQLEEVVVTGSRISRSDATSPSPLSVFSDVEIDSAGTLSVSEVLRRDPAAGSQGFGPSMTLRGAGQVGVDLRNLGSARTLAVINGKRFPMVSDAIGNLGQDIGAIPTAMIGRIEMLRDGASTAYGADAVAGVVNFVLDDEFDGIEFDSYAGISGQGDGLSYRASVKLGTVFDRGSFLLVGQYQDQDDILQYEREWARNPISSIPFMLRGSAQTPGGRVFANGALIACYPIGGGANIAPNCERNDNSLQQSLIGGIEKTSVGAVVRYDVTDMVKFSADAFYTQRNGYQTIAASRQLNTGGQLGPYTGGFVIPATSATNPYGQDVTFEWRPTTYGPQATRSDVQLLWTSFGLSGELGGRFNWDVSHTFSRSTADSTLSNVPVATNLRLLLDPAQCALDPGCASVGAIGSLAGILSQSEHLTQAQQDYLFATTATDTEFKTQQTIATIGGSLWSLPAGDLQAVLGLERRNEFGDHQPDTLLQSGNAVGSFVFPGGGEFSTKEVFAELEIPLLAGAPGAERLDLNLQGRYSDFSNFGGADTYKVGLNYTPVRDVRFRATYGTSFRAPNVMDLYGGGLGATSIFLDPCNSTGLRATNAQVDTNCDALGVPENFEQSQPSLPIRGGGNPALQPEEGEAFTVGAVFQPRFLPGLTASVDYFSFDIEEAISSDLLQQNINNCYADPNLAARGADVNDICFTFADRMSSGPLARVLSRSVNIAKLSTSGIDFNVQYLIEQAGPGELTFDLRLSHLLEYLNGDTDYAGTYVGLVEGAQSYPLWRGNLNIQYAMDPLTLSWRVNYVGSMKDSFIGTLIPADNPLNYSGTPDYFTHDLLARWTVTDSVEATVGVNNIMDKDPPYAFETTRNTLPTTFDQIGRYFFAGARFSF